MICFKHGVIRPDNLFWNICSNFFYNQKQKKPVKFSRRKMITLRGSPIEKFMKEYYIPALEKYLYHIFSVHILSNIYVGNKKWRLFLYKGNILSVRDYTERLSAHFNLEIQFDHFGNGRSLSIEGYNIKFVDKITSHILKFILFIQMYMLK